MINNIVIAFYFSWNFKSIKDRIKIFHLIIRFLKFISAKYIYIYIKYKRFSFQIKLWCADYHKETFMGRIGNGRQVNRL